MTPPATTFVWCHDNRGTRPMGRGRGVGLTDTLWRACSDSAVPVWPCSPHSSSGRSRHKPLGSALGSRVAGCWPCSTHPNSATLAPGIGPAAGTRVAHPGPASTPTISGRPGGPAPHHAVFGWLAVGWGAIVGDSRPSDRRTPQRGRCIAAARGKAPRRGALTLEPPAARPSTVGIPIRPRPYHPPGGLLIGPAVDRPG